MTTCKDLDHDCFGMKDHLRCWLYDPAKGMCPFLRSTPQSYFTEVSDPNSWSVPDGEANAVPQKGNV